MEANIWINALAVFAPLVTIVAGLYALLINALRIAIGRHFKHDIRHSLLTNIGALTRAESFNKMLVRRSKLDFVVGPLFAIIGLFLGYLGSYLVDIPNVFLTAYVQYPIVLWLLIWDFIALIGYKVARDLATLRLSKYVELDSFKGDFESEQFSRRILSKWVVAKGPITLGFFLFINSLSLLVISIYSWGVFF
ncbi:MAG: hypothetical protein JRN15_24260, partial [Nitrososphaerota archaeon]|nr:hypothetical protein [Nitrososphaerota archaeon]